MSNQQRKSIAYLRTPNVQNLVRELRQLRNLVALISSHIKTKGISEASYVGWQKSLRNYRKTHALTSRSEKLVVGIKDYLKEQKAKLPGRDYLLCCSDIIESMFGKYKNKGGMKVISSDVLYLPLVGKTITPDRVVEGLSRVSQKRLNE